MPKSDSSTSSKRRRTGRGKPKAGSRGPNAALVLARLPEVERDVISRRMGLHDGHMTSRADVARALGLTSSEVTEIETRALSRLRDVVGESAARALLAG